MGRAAGTCVELKENRQRVPQGTYREGLLTRPVQKECFYFFLQGNVKRQTSKACSVYTIVDGNSGGCITYITGTYSTVDGMSLVVAHLVCSLVVNNIIISTLLQ